MPLFALTVWPVIAMLLVQKVGRTKGTIWAIMIGALLQSAKCAGRSRVDPPQVQSGRTTFSARAGSWGRRALLHR